MDYMLFWDDIHKFSISLVDYIGIGKRQPHSRISFHGLHPLSKKATNISKTICWLPSKFKTQVTQDLLIY